jgi:hypothetical protein
MGQKVEEGGSWQSHKLNFSWLCVCFVAVIAHRYQISHSSAFEFGLAPTKSFPGLELCAGAALFSFRGFQFVRLSSYSFPLMPSLKMAVMGLSSLWSSSQPTKSHLIITYTFYCFCSPGEPWLTEAVSESFSNNSWSTVLADWGFQSKGFTSARRFRNIIYDPPKQCQDSDILYNLTCQIASQA